MTAPQKAPVFSAIDRHSRYLHRPAVTLLDLPVGVPARLAAVQEPGRPVMLRLMEMGLVPGASVRVRRRGPLGGPLELNVGGYLLTVRAAEAARLSVEPD